jgi:putative membrane protein
MNLKFNKTSEWRRYTMAIIFSLAFIGCVQEKTYDAIDQADAINDSLLDDSEKDVQKDADFIVDEVAGNYAKIKMAQTAVERSSNEEVKQMAKIFVDDYTDLLHKFTGFANKNGIAIPTEESANQKDMIVKLRETDSSDFDKEWFETFHSSIKKSIDAYEKRLDRTDDMELRNVLGNTLPVLKTNMGSLTTIKQKVK